MIIVPCARCGKLCRVAEGQNEEAVVMKAAIAPDGFCINCAATEWVQLSFGIPLIIDDFGPQVLLSPEWQAAAPRLLAAAYSDADPALIDWTIVVNNWHLPFPTEPSHGHTKRHRSRGRVQKRRQ